VSSGWHRPTSASDEAGRCSSDLGERTIFPERTESPRMAPLVPRSPPSRRSVRSEVRWRQSSRPAPARHRYRHGGGRAAPRTPSATTGRSHDHHVGSTANVTALGHDRSCRPGQPRHQSWSPPRELPGATARRLRWSRWRGCCFGSSRVTHRRLSRRRVAFALPALRLARSLERSAIPLLTSMPRSVADMPEIVEEHGRDR
jgi:hypothetical protein